MDTRLNVLTLSFPEIENLYSIFLHRLEFIYESKLYLCLYMEVNVEYCSISVLICVPYTSLVRKTNII